MSDPAIAVIGASRRRDTIGYPTAQVVEAAEQRGQSGAEGLVVISAGFRPAFVSQSGALGVSVLDSVNSAGLQCRRLRTRATAVHPGVGHERDEPHCIKGPLTVPIGHRGCYGK